MCKILVAFAAFVACATAAQLIPRSKPFVVPFVPSSFTPYIKPYQAVYNPVYYPALHYDDGKYRPNAFERLAPIKPITVQPVFTTPIIRGGPIFRSSEGQAITLSKSNIGDPITGSYNFQYATQNGIQAEESNAPKVLPNGQISSNVHGSFSYVAPTGEHVAVKYIADENGFQPIQKTP